ncbi:MAG: hypothetical protein E6G96_07745 [Alphaproteobacteria bacterium]|nr:MAG: hypothetical protein E6G96_07745 [Alphaproteobacteria bacterium]
MPTGAWTGRCPRVSFDPDGVAIERLHIGDGRAILYDAASGARVALEKLEFRGELRSLSGPIKGEGSFVIGGRHFPYRLAASRIDGDSAIKVRLAVDPIDRPLTAEADISISFDRGTPRFEGNVQFARPVGRAPVGSQSLIIEPWRLTGRIKGDSAAAALEQIEFQYGPDERATKLRGTADLKFGREPRMSIALSSPQIDVDRMLSLSEATRRPPLATAKMLAESLSGSLRLPIPALLTIGVESVSLAGSLLQRLSAEIESDGERVAVKTLEFRAPGVTQVRLRGNLATAPSGIAFTGTTNIDSNDPRSLVAWLTDGSDGQLIASGALRFVGDISLSPEGIAVEHLGLDLDRMNVAGRFAYAWERDRRPARLDAAFTAPEIDLDRLRALTQALLGQAMFAWPREGTISLKTDRALLLGVQARQADVNLRLDASGLAIDPLLVADFGGAALAVRGRIDTSSPSPRGTVTIDLDARALDGILALLEKVAPEAAERLRSSAGRLTPMVLRASLTMDPGSTSNLLANAKFKADGRAGAFRLALLGDATGASDAFKADKIAALSAAKINLMGRLDTDDWAALIELARLDRFIGADKRAGQLTLAVKGKLDGELEVESRFAAGPTDIASNGKVRILPQASRRAELDLKLSNVNLRSPRPVSGGRTAELLPASLTARLAATADSISISDIKGKVSGAGVAGQLSIGLQQPTTIDGAIDLGTIALPAALATIAGVPLRGASAGANAAPVWPTEPFEQMLGPLSGQVSVRSARVALTPKLEARDVKATAHFGASHFALEVIEGGLAGGLLGGELILLQGREGLIGRARFRLAGANAAELLPGDGAISGRLTFEANAEGTGMSPVALIGSLEGSGTFTLENGRVARLDPKAFELVMRAVDQGLPIDANRLRDRTDAALASGTIGIARGEGAITIAAGQARLSNAMAGERGSDLAITARLNLADSELDARLILSSATAAATAANAPEITIGLKGPLGAPKRSIDVAAFASWLALRAVEQQSKKLEVLEGREKPAAPGPGAAVERSPERAATDGVQAEVPAVPSIASSPDAASPRPPIRSVQKPKSSERPHPAPEPAPRRLLFGIW